MHWIDWVVVTFYILGSTVTISQVGKPRKPMEPEVAALATLINAAIVVAIIITHT